MPKGHLVEEWADWFDSLTLTLEDNGDTLLIGPLADQAALHGLLRRVRDLGVPLLSVVNVEPDSINQSNSGQIKSTRRKNDY